MTTAERATWGACAGLLAFIGSFAWDRWGPAPARDGEAPETAHAAALAVEREPLAWVEAWFAKDLPPMGPAPAAWTPLEADLDPAACGACHVQQYLDWKESWHALAMGPGTMGQLVAWDGEDDEMVAKCQRCHAPLAEQHPASPAFVPALRDDGLTCAGCHVRAWTRHGPPKDGPPMDGAPHGGFVAREEFRDGRFCEACHDFETDKSSLYGKKVQETWLEWRASRYAAKGVTCQDCHMPEGRHTWKGVHDPETVRRGLRAEARFDGLAGEVRVTNVGAGHRLPTYSTPEIVVYVDQLDAAGRPLGATRRVGVIGRRLSVDAKTEVFDTRLLPDETYTLRYDVPAAKGAVAVRARVECWPDEAYRRFYEHKLADPDWNPDGRAQIEQALLASIASRFVVWEETLAVAGVARD
ncbi:MAG: multiheme c-type cytochrome [Myxococcota bacterium]